LRQPIWILNDMGKLQETFLECERLLEEIRYTPGTEARMRRIAINNAMADVLYAAAEKLKEEGHTQGYNLAHDAANKHWSAVREELADINPTDLKE
jgi:hypothetical protein